MSPHASLPLTSVVVPVRNGAATIGNCLAALLNTDYPADRREILVVYTPSTDATEEIIGRYPVRCIREERRGLSQARNTGVEASRGQIIAFTDADCYASTGWLSELVRGFSDGAVSAVAGEVVAYPPRTPAEHYAALRKPQWQEWTRRGRRRPWFLFGNAAVVRGVFERVGGFDTRFDGGSEDIDYSWRFFRAGLRLGYRPRAIVLHHHRATRRGLFTQHIGYGRGQAVLRRKYPEELQWGWREELGAWKDLGASAWAAATVWTRSNRQREQSVGLYYPYFDFLRKLGQRIGFTREAAAFRLATLVRRQRPPMQLTD